MLCSFYHNLAFDDFVKNPEIVMPDLIRHPEHIEHA